MGDTQFLADSIQQIVGPIKGSMGQYRCLRFTIDRYFIVKCLAVSSDCWDDLSCFNIYPSNQGTFSTLLLLFLVPVCGGLIGIGDPWSFVSLVNYCCHTSLILVMCIRGYITMIYLLV